MRPCTAEGQQAQAARNSYVDLQGLLGLSDTQSVACVSEKASGPTNMRKKLFSRLLLLMVIYHPFLDSAYDLLKSSPHLVDMEYWVFPKILKSFKAASYLTGAPGNSRRRIRAHKAQFFIESFLNEPNQPGASICWWPVHGFDH